MIRRMLICGVLGALTTVAVAWGCALLIDARAGVLSGSMYWGYGDTWSYWIFKRSGALIVQRATKGIKGEVDLLHPAHEDLLPTWSKVREEPGQEERLFRGTWIEDARGWPLLALRSEQQYPQPNPPPMLRFVWANSVQLGGVAPAPLTVPPSPLPVRPIWSGFVVNSTLYGSIWFLALSAPRLVRRLLRARAHRCRNCGYDLRYCISDRCPECGVIVLTTQKSSATAGEPAR